MQNYRAVVHYHFKKGMEEQGLKFLVNELVNKAPQYGCHHIELLQDHKDHCNLIGIATWNDIEDARRFQLMWTKKEKEMLHFCTNPPKREFCKLRSTFMEKAKRVA